MDNKTHPEDGQKKAEEAVVLAPRERDGFSGTTIEQNGGRQENGKSEQTRNYQRGSSEQRGYVRTVSFGGGLSGLLGWLIVLGILFFVLPAFFLLAAAIAAVWFVLRLFR